MSVSGAFTNLRLMLHWGYPWMIVWVCAVHIIIGAGLFLRPQTESLLIISGLNKFGDVPLVDRHVLGAVLIVTAIMALGGLLAEGHWTPKTCLAMLIWQYGIVFGSFLSDIVVIWNGVNPSTGTSVDRIVILVVVAPIMLAGPFHTMSIIERFVIYPRRSLV